MNPIENARMSGALDRVTAAGLTVKRVLVDAPDGPITLTVVDLGPGRLAGTPDRAVLPRSAASTRR